MNILYILKRDPDTTLNEILSEHKKAHDVTVVDLRNEKDHGKVVDLIASHEKIISW